ncbi:hypothetical protein DL767_009837 [Monosporascus sp. MG133]|nr:hypothetical protein DL767_009837 [Monosporascus sp. MG133]
MDLHLGQEAVFDEVRADDEFLLTAAPDFGAVGVQMVKSIPRRGGAIVNGLSSSSDIDVAVGIEDYFALQQGRMRRESEKSTVLGAS